MATTSSPPSPMYDPEHRTMQEYYYPPGYGVQHSGHSHYYYSSPDGSSANSFDGTHDASAVAANQVPASHQYYGDAASSGVIPYSGEYISQSGADWVQEKQAQPDTAHPYGMVQPLPPFYDSGEVSPASDDSNGNFYDSPQQSDDARLVDERGCGEAHPHACHPPFSGYESTSAFPPPAVITAEQYSYATSQEHAPELSQASPVYYAEDGTTFQPPLSHLPYTPDFARTSDENVRTGSLEFLERPASGDNQRNVSPVRYPGAVVQPHRVSRASTSVTMPSRAESPMGHLPYNEADPYVSAADHHAAYYHPSSSTQFSYGRAVAHPQPVYAQTPYTTLQQQPQTFPEPISIPAPRSPPLVEDMPKKPLTLACFFCRKRKIACGSPPPGKKDRTCNQCARRNLRCEYPANSRRGTRQREVEPSLYPMLPAGYARVSG